MVRQREKLASDTKSRRPENAASLNKQGAQTRIRR